MNKTIQFFVFLFFGIIVLSIFLPGIYLSSDIFRTIPQYADEYGWQKTKNSLLADPLFQFEPWRHYAKERLGSGELPFINDRSSLGAPFLANQINAIFFPLNIFYYFLPVHVSLFLIHFLKVYFLLLFTFLYLRALFIRRELSLLGSSAVSFAAFPIVWLAWPQINVYLLFPLILFLTEKIRSENDGKNVWYISLSLAYFTAILGGHPETLFHIGILHFFYCIVMLKDFKKIVKTFFFIFLGFTLAAFQLTPFLEYLFQSYMLEYRLELAQGFSHPISSTIMNIVPFIFGAPHLEFYKPLWTGTNFQELIGGYIGPSLFLLGLISAFKLPKRALSVFWIVVFIASFGISYGIFPFSLINLLPVFNTSANHRFIGFAGFSLIILSMLFLNSLKRLDGKDFRGKKITYIVFVTILIGLLYVVFPFANVPFVDPKVSDFIPFLKYHIAFLLVSSVVFFSSLIRYIKTKSMYPIIGMFVGILSQTAVLFLVYNPITQTDEYYPETSLTRVLKSLPEGVYIEVGNPSIPENSNLPYNLKSIENYDALEIASFKHKLKELFPTRNHWGNVETLTQKGLDYFGIKYVISDHDVRMKTRVLHPEHHMVLSPITRESPVDVSLQHSGVIKGIRILPATFNRHNSCMFTVSIEALDEEEVFSKDIACSDFFNNTFYTVDTPPLDISENKNYVVDFSTNTSNPSEVVSFFGNSKQPYLEIITDEKSDVSNLTFIEKGKQWYVFLNPSAKFYTNNGTAQILTNGPEHIEMYVNQKTDGIFQIKRASYRGWEAFVDNRKIALTEDPLLTIQLSQGSHHVMFRYLPHSFYLGALVSILMTLGIAVYLLRGVSPNSSFIHEVRDRTNKISWSSHVIAITLFMIVSVLLLYIFFSFFPLQISVPQTTVINWFTVHQYPKSQDLLYFLLSFPAVIVLTLTFWFIWVKRK